MIWTNMAGAQLAKDNRVVSFTWNPDEGYNVHVAFGTKTECEKSYIYSIRKGRKLWKELRAEGYERKRVW